MSGLHPPLVLLVIDPLELLHFTVFSCICSTLPETCLPSLRLLRRREELRNTREEEQPLKIQDKKKNKKTLTFISAETLFFLLPLHLFSYLDQFLLSSHKPSHKTKTSSWFHKKRQRASHLQIHI